MITRKKAPKVTALFRKMFDSATGPMFPFKLWQTGKGPTLMYYFYEDAADNGPAKPVNFWSESQAQVVFVKAYQAGVASTQGELTNLREKVRRLEAGNIGLTAAMMADAVRWRAK